MPLTTLLRAGENDFAMNTDLLLLDNAVEHDPAIEAWFEDHTGELGAIARYWFKIMRQSGDEVRELLHDGCPVVCLGNVPFAYVNVFTAHVNVGFFQGASLPDPGRLLEGAGKRMRHVKVSPARPVDDSALAWLIAAAWSQIKSRVENG